MAMQLFLDQPLLIDKLKNSLNQLVHIELHPSRNKIEIDSTSNLNYIYKICNDKLKKIIQFYPLLEFKSNTYILYNKNIVIKDHAKNVMISERIVVDDQIYTIHRHLITFAQNDDTLRFAIHNAIYRFIKSKNIIFDKAILLGGEMYIFGKIFNSFFKEKIYISDMESIIYDARLNNIFHDNSSYYLLNYDVDKLDFIKNSDIMICNVSKHYNNLCLEIIKIRPEYLILIICDIKSVYNFYNDFKDVYKLTNTMVYKTNYNIYLLFYVKN